MFGLPSWYQYTGKTFAFYVDDIFPYITPFVYPIGLIAQTGSVYLTLMVTMERYVAVCLPLKARIICTYGRAKTSVILAGILATLYNIPRFFEITRATTFDNTRNRNITQVSPTDLRLNPTYINVYITWMYLVVMYILPFSCLAVFNFLIYRAVRVANTQRIKLSRLQKREISLATMLMCVVWVFFICNVLPLVVNVLEVLGIEKTALTQTSNLLVTLNSSVNFIIYCIFGDKFKRIFMRLLCGYKHSTLNRKDDEDEVQGQGPSSQRSYRFKKYGPRRLKTVRQPRVEFDGKGLGSSIGFEYGTPPGRGFYGRNPLSELNLRPGELPQEDLMMELGPSSADLLQNMRMRATPV